MKLGSILSYVSRKNGGIFESVRRMQSALAAQPGLDVSVWGVEDEFTRQDEPLWAPVPVRAFPIIGPAQFSYSPRLRDAFLGAGHDIVHTHGLWQYPSYLVYQWHKKTRRPYIVSPHGMLDPWAVQNSGWKKKLARLLYEEAHLQHAAVLHALCEPEAREIRKFGLKNPLCLIPNGIDLPPETPASASRREPPFDALPPDRRVLLYLGRIHPKKGLVNLVRAWKSLHADKVAAARDWVVAIVGWDQGGHEDELRALVRELDLERDIFFLGAQFGAAKAACYRQCDAFILPSLSEGLPMVVLEAWAYGKPVVMTPECNLAPGFDAGAALRAQANPEGVSEALRHLVTMSEAERAAMGARGLELVRRDYTWPEIARELAAVYRWTLGEGPEPVSIQKGREVA